MGVFDVLDFIFSNTSAFLEAMPKKERKRKGQFFTSLETAKYMAGLFSFDKVYGEISVLDPGAGTGVLSAAIVQRIQAFPNITSVKLTCYETDKEVLPVLAANLNYIKEKSRVPFDYSIIERDYLVSQATDFERTLLANPHPPKYDFIIGNPPYLRVLKNHPAALSMPSVVHGAPNLYYLFAAMSLFNLKDNSEMVYILPRSWTSGAYFKAFRQYLLKHGRLEHIHLFVSRDKVFSQEQVLQETIIIKVKKTNITPESVTLSSSRSSKDFDAVSTVIIPYESVVVGEDYYVFLPTNQDEINVIRKINKYSSTMPDIGVRMKTGVIVDFRQYDDLRREQADDNCPLFYSQHIRNGRVYHQPSGKEFDWVITSKPSLVQKNKDYVFCKRFTAKEERRRLQCGIYLAADFPEYSCIGTQNKINFVECIDGTEMDKPELYGIFALLNSTLFDMYYRILNGSTQVNSTEVNSIPVPPLSVIKEIGSNLIKAGDLTTEHCDKILGEVAYG